MSKENIRTAQSEYRMGVFCILSLIVTAFVVWKWFTTIQELNAISDAVTIHAVEDLQKGIREKR